MAMIRMDPIEEEPENVSENTRQNAERVVATIELNKQPVADHETPSSADSGMEGNEGNRNPFALFDPRNSANSDTDDVLITVGEIDEFRLRNSMLGLVEGNGSGKEIHTDNKFVSDVRASTESNKITKDGSENAPACGDGIFVDGKCACCSSSHIHQPTPWMERVYLFPLIYCSPNGTISVMMRTDTIVELTVDRGLRVCCAGKFAAAVNPRATAACIIHPKARIFQEETKVYSSFGNGEKLAVVGPHGIIFTMKGHSEAFLVNVNGTIPYPRNMVTFPELPKDASLALFYSAQHGRHLYNNCLEIIRNGRHQTIENGTICTMNGIEIKQTVDGIIEVSCRPRFITMDLIKGHVSVRTHYVHMGVEGDGKAFIKRGLKRVHASTSGMVVSDGNQGHIHKPSYSRRTAKYDLKSS